MYIYITQYERERYVLYVCASIRDLSLSLSHICTRSTSRSRSPGLIPLFSTPLRVHLSLSLSRCRYAPPFLSICLQNPLPRPQRKSILHKPIAALQSCRRAPRSLAENSDRKPYTQPPSESLNPKPSTQTPKPSTPDPQTLNQALNPIFSAPERQS